MIRILILVAMLTASMLMTVVSGFAKPHKTASDPIVTVTISPAQIDSLHTTAIQIIPAQGVGTLIVVDDIVAVDKGGTVAYSGGSDQLTLYYDDGSATGTNADSFVASISQLFGSLLTQSATGFRWQADIATNGVNVAADENKAIMLSNQGTAYAGGNTSLELIVTYHVVTP